MNIWPYFLNILKLVYLLTIIFIFLKLVLNDVGGKCCETKPAFSTAFQGFLVASVSSGDK